VRLRPAADGDAFMLWRWNVHPETRTYFRRPDPPGWTEFAARHAARLNGLEPVVSWDVYEVGGAPVGVVTVKQQADGTYEVEALVAPEHRGKGHGTRMVAAATAKHWPQQLVAYVHAGNAASVKAFRRAGYLERPELRSGPWLALASS
jgi:RimJ/RimL family protein N-acetyltransferase